MFPHSWISVVKTAVVYRKTVVMWLIRYRELIKILTVADLKLRYRSSTLGFAWTMLNPFLMMLVLYTVFYNVFKMKEQNLALYLLIGIVTWRFLANGTLCSIGAIVHKSSLVTKIYIPRQILVFSSVLSCFISSLLEFAVLMLLLPVLGVKVSLYFCVFPLVHIIYLLMVYGISLALAALFVYYRDLQQIWDVLLQAGFFLSPIVYPISTVPEEYLRYYMLNPVTAVMQIYRQTMLYGAPPSILDFAVICIAAGLSLAVGCMFFLRLEPRFAEEI